MLEPCSIRSLNSDDKVILRQHVVHRWKITLRNFLISILLPVLCGGAILLLLNAPILYGKIVDWLHGIKPVYEQHYILPHNMDGLLYYCEAFLLWIPVYIMIVIANLIVFLYKIPPVYIDIISGQKKILYFNPEPYSPPDIAQYFIKIGDGKYPFYQVSYEQYCQLDSSKNFSLETSRYAKILLALKNETGKSILDTK